MERSPLREYFRHFRRSFWRDGSPKSEQEMLIDQLQTEVIDLHERITKVEALVRRLQEKG